MKYNIIKQKDLTCTKWSGGTTTQLFIFPEGLTVKDDFKIRISTATVDKGESTFTFFKGYNRFLTLLNGEMNISHELSRESFPGLGAKIVTGAELKTFEPHCFSGDSLTSSSSTVDLVDFNVIYKKELGELKLDTLDSVDKFSKVSFSGTSFIYNFENSCEIFVENEKIVLEEKELIVFESDSQFNGKIKGKVIFGELKF